MNTNELIRSRRKELKLTMRQVADYVGVSEATVSRWESGNIANMGRDKIALLSKVLKISPGLIAGYDEVQPETLSDDELDRQIIEVFNRLSEEKQKQALDYLTFLASQE